jgi:hypothetical protein
MSGEQDKGTDSPSSDDKAKRLEQDIQEIRGKLGGMVGELDHRRHDLFDVKKQLGRHAVPLTLAGVALLGLAAGGVALTVRRHRQREALSARLVRFRRALARMIDKPERVANAPSAQWKMATAVAAAIVSVVAKRWVESALAGRATAARGNRSEAGRR